jgi:hypothetical protein
MKDLAPRARFELATLRLTAECSTIELPGKREAGPSRSDGEISLTNGSAQCQRNYTISARDTGILNPP